MMRNKHIARALYNRTKAQDCFSVNDLRKPPKGGKPLSDIFKHPNEIGAFFGDLSKAGLAYKIGYTKATHAEAKGRVIREWIWTKKAKIHFSVVPFGQGG